MNEEKTISVIQIMNGLKQQRMYIVGSVLAGVIIAMAYYFMSPPVFECRGMIEVGQVGQVGQVEDPRKVFVRLNDQGKKIKSGEKGFLSTTSFMIEIPRGGPPNVISFRVRGNNPEEARESINVVGNRLVSEHQLVFSRMIAPLRYNFAAMQGRISSLEIEEELVEKLLVDCAGDCDLATDTLLRLQKQRIGDERNALNVNILTLQNTLFETQTFPTRWVGELSVVEERMPRKFMGAFFIAVFVPSAMICIRNMRVLLRYL